MIEAAQGTALSFRIALLTQKYCYFIASVSLGGKGTSCSHISSTVAEELTGAFLVLVREVRLGGSTWDAQVVQVAVG